MMRHCLDDDDDKGYRESRYDGPRPGVAFHGIAVAPIRLNFIPNIPGSLCQLPR